MAALRDLDRAVERRWPWLMGWDHISTAAHARYVMGVLAVGLLASFVFYLNGNAGSAWGVAVATTGAALGALFRLAVRLSRTPGAP